MKEDLLVKTFGDAVTRQMNEDMGDMCTEMASSNSHMRNIKVKPAYEHIDVFERQRIEASMRFERERIEDNAAKGRLIQPDDPSKPKVRVILPNE